MKTFNVELQGNKGKVKLISVNAINEDDCSTRVINYLRYQNYKSFKIKDAN